MVSFTIWVGLITMDSRYDARDKYHHHHSDNDEQEEDGVDYDVGDISGMAGDGCTLGFKRLGLGELLARESVVSLTTLKSKDLSESPLTPLIPPIAPCMMLYRLYGIRYNYGAYEVRISTLGSVRASLAVKLVWLPTRRRYLEADNSTNTPVPLASSRRRLTDIHKVIFRADTVVSPDVEEAHRVVWPIEGHDGPLVQFRTSNDMKSHYYNFASLPLSPTHTPYLTHLGDYPVEVVDKSVDLYAVVWCTSDWAATSVQRAVEMPPKQHIVQYTITMDRMYLGQFPSSALHSLAMLVVPVTALTLGVVPWLMSCIRL